jgi:adenylate kinase
MQYNTFIFLGKPGSGKGEQSKALAEKIDFPIISSGGRFREIATHDTIVGRKVGDIINHGYLMPHWFASYIFLDIALNLKDGAGAIFDGAARKKPEAELFDSVMQWLERPYKAIYINVQDEIAVDRIMKRKDLEGRKDDDEEAVQIRLKQYYDEAYPAIEYFRSTDNFLEINGDQTIEAVHADILTGIGYN